MCGTMPHLATRLRLHATAASGHWTASAHTRSTCRPAYMGQSAVPLPVTMSIYSAIASKVTTAPLHIDPAAPGHVTCRQASTGQGNVQSQNALTVRLRLQQHCPWLTYCRPCSLDLRPRCASASWLRYHTDSHVVNKLTRGEQTSCLAPTGAFTTASSAP
jgi:hypothetical protein